MKPFMSERGRGLLERTISEARFWDHVVVDTVNGPYNLVRGAWLSGRADDLFREAVHKGNPRVALRAKMVEFSGNLEGLSGLLNIASFVLPLLKGGGAAASGGARLPGEEGIEFALARELPGASRAAELADLAAGSFEEAHIAINPTLVANGRAAFTSRLRSLIDAFHSALPDEIRRRMSTSAVVETENGLIFTNSSRYIGKHLSVLEEAAYRLGGQFIADTRIASRITSHAEIAAGEMVAVVGAKIADAVLAFFASRP